MLAKCENCGGALRIPAGASQVQCVYCGSQTLLGGAGSPSPVGLRIAPPPKPSMATQWIFGVLAAVFFFFAVVLGVVGTVIPGQEGALVLAIVCVFFALMFTVFAVVSYIYDMKPVRFRARALPGRGTLIALRILPNGKTGLDLNVEIQGRPPWSVTIESEIPQIIIPRLVSGFSLPVAIDPEDLTHIEVQWHLL